VRRLIRDLSVAKDARRARGILEQAAKRTPQ